MRLARAWSDTKRLAALQPLTFGAKAKARDDRPHPGLMTKNRAGGAWLFDK
jgi:hypothetical protein